MAQIGVALIGAGMIAKTHVAALSALQPRYRLETIVSRRPDRAEYLTSYYAGPSPQFTNNLSVVLEIPNIKIAIVATPPSVRIDLIQSLAKAGKHVLLEKPIARNVDESKQVVELCKSADVTLGIVFQHRMRETSKAAARLISSGKLGNIGYVEIAVPLWRPQSYYDEFDRGTYSRDGGGVLITQAIHTIDLALSLTGPVSRVHAMTATTPLHQMEAEDLAVVGMHFASGAVGSMVASTATFPHGKESITLHCEYGSVQLRSDALNIFWRDGRSENDRPDIGTGGSIEARNIWHQRVIEDFMESIEQNSAPMVSGRDALVSHSLIEAIETSSQTGSPVNVRD